MERIKKTNNIFYVPVEKLKVKDMVFSKDGYCFFVDKVKISEKKVELNLSSIMVRPIAKTFRVGTKIKAYKIKKG